MVLLDAALVGFVGALTAQIVGYMVAWRLRRVDIVDTMWGVSFVMIVVALQLWQRQTNAVSVLMQLLVVIWAIRLSWHIFRRFRCSVKQDERYTALMQTWPTKGHWGQVFLRIFVMQALLASVVSAPIMVTHTGGALRVRVATIVGLVVWATGFIYEVVADRQLKQFLMSVDRPVLMTRGLWRYSRHPNYFGEITMWWGLAIMAISARYGWIGLIGAATITFLICFVSGIPPVEARMSTKPGWEIYRQKTSALIPLPPTK